MARFGDDGRRAHASVGTGPRWWVTRAWSRRQGEASGQQSEPRPATHLALQQLQAVGVPCDRALAPGPGHRGLNRGVVRAESSGETPEGREGTGGRACQPRVKGAWLTPADEGSEVLPERHRSRPRGAG
jgi:hypothetical protein